jgi:hypothetical protein
VHTNPFEIPWVKVAKSRAKGQLEIGLRSVKRIDRNRSAAAKHVLIPNVVVAQFRFRSLDTVWLACLCAKVTAETTEDKRDA